MAEILPIILDWRVLLICFALLVTFPLVFFLSSLDKSTVKVKKIKMKEKPAKQPAARPQNSKMNNNTGKNQSGKKT